MKNGISTCLYAGYPNLFMQFSKQPEWVADGHWYNGVEYYKDRDRGIPYKEDLWVPGYFELPISKGESIIFSASTFEADPDTFIETYENELTSRTCRTSFYNCLKNSAKQFYLKNKSGMYIMAGYPWYNVRARDELMALPGCTLAIDHKEDFELIMETFLNALSHLLNDGIKDRTIGEIDLPDIPLWTIWAIQQYRRATSSRECREKYGENVRYIVEAIRNGKVNNLQLDQNGLLTSNGIDSPVTWLSASINGRHYSSHRIYP